MPLWIKLIVFAPVIALLASLVAWSVVGRAAAHPETRRLVAGGTTQNDPVKAATGAQDEERHLPGTERATPKDAPGDSPNAPEPDGRTHRSD